MAATSAMESAPAVALRSVLNRVGKATEVSGRRPDQVKVVAVSKTKPVSVLREVYDAGHRCFGENYVQEIVDKAPQMEVNEYQTENEGDGNRAVGIVVVVVGGVVENTIMVVICGGVVVCKRGGNGGLRVALPEDIEWHFIGNLQSNKVKALLCKALFSVRCPNLAMVETVDDEKVSNDWQHIANHLDRAVGNLEENLESFGPSEYQWRNMICSCCAKFGVEPSGCVDLAKHVCLNCPNLEFCGLMTIGMLDYTSTPENFKTLANCSRSEVCRALGIKEDQCELSMGMSSDFDLAIEMGSSIVRIGSTIFGAREYPKKQQS
ncbi:Pyridoxal phosphate homeostasis protein [Bienertia sinuspersici]